MSPRLRAMEGSLYKWTNYYNGWQPRWFVLDGGVLSYYDSKEDVRKGSKGSLKMAVCEIQVCPSDDSRLELVIPGEQHFYLRAASAAERQSWVVALGSAKACLTDSRTRKEKEIVEASDSLRSKMSEMRLYYDLMTQQVSLIRRGIQEPRPDVQRMSEASSLLSATCDTFALALEECVHTAAASVRPAASATHQRPSPPLARKPVAPRSPQRPTRNKSRGRVPHAESAARSLPRAAPPPPSRKREPGGSRGGRTSPSSSSSSSRRRPAMASTRVGAIAEEVEEGAEAEGEARPEPTARGDAAITTDGATAAGEAAPCGDPRRADVAQEGAAQEGVAQEAVAQEAVAQEGVAQEALAQEAVAQETVTQETVAQEAVAQEAMAQEGVAQEGVAQEGVAQEGVAQEGVAQEAFTQEGAAQEAVAQEAFTQEAVAQEGAAQDALAQEALAQEAVAQEAVVQEAAPTHGATAGSDGRPRDGISNDSTQESRKPGEHPCGRGDSAISSGVRHDVGDDASDCGDGGDGGDCGDGAGGAAGVANGRSSTFVPTRGGGADDPGMNSDTSSAGDCGLEMEQQDEERPGEDSGGETVKTFFSVMEQRFSDAELQDEREIRVEPFLRACASIVPVLDKLGPTAFAPVKLDFVGNIRKITQKYDTDRAGFPTLQSIVGDEVRSGTAARRNSTTEALLWLKRGLKFLLELLTEVRGGEMDLHVALSSAYGRTLRRYHGWVVRGVFALALRAAPTLDGFLAALAAREGDATGAAFRRQLDRDLDVYLGAMRRQLAELDRIYEQNQLESDCVV